MKEAFADVQRIVMSGGRWRYGRQLAIAATQPTRLLYLLNRLLKLHPPSQAGGPDPEVQLSLGFTRRGLEHALVPRHVLAALAARAPAFTAGAALRAARHVGSCGPDDPRFWDPAFNFMALDAVLSLHGLTVPAMDRATVALLSEARKAEVPVTVLPHAEWPAHPEGHHYVHFGYRDGLSRVGVEGWTDEESLAQCRPYSRHAAGEFVLGHQQNSGANPWLSSDGRRVWPMELRAFFHNASFGVLHQMEQYVDEFNAFVLEAARQTGLAVEQVRAKLCGRTSDGRPVGRGPDADPGADFGYEDDKEGLKCPMGAHVRRMNPRDALVAQPQRRALLRRGMPYGAPSNGGGESCGLMGIFFCASIEDQFEHLLAQWADRVPLGSGDLGGARDPLIGAHEPGDGPFHIPGTATPVRGLRRFTRTRGTAYLFYPSVTALSCIAANQVFADTTEPPA